MLFWMKKGRGYVSKKAVFSKGKKRSRKGQPILMSVTSIQDSSGDKEKSKMFVYAGSTKGQVYCWNPGKPSIDEDGKSAWTAEDTKNCQVEPVVKKPYVFKGNFGAVNVLKRIDMENTYRLLAAGKGGYISILNANGTDISELMTFSLSEKLIDNSFFDTDYKHDVFHSLDPQIRAVDINFASNDGEFKMIFGTKGSEIYEVQVKDRRWRD